MKQSERVGKRKKITSTPMPKTGSAAQGNQVGHAAKVQGTAQMCCLQKELMKGIQDG
jgi:hypothetical protein